jgi:hypothetical protein
MNWNKIINNITEIAIFFGTLITLYCLVVFMFISAKPWMALLAGIAGVNTLFTFDRYRNKKP